MPFGLSILHRLVLRLPAMPFLLNFACEVGKSWNVSTCAKSESIDLPGSIWERSFLGSVWKLAWVFTLKWLPRMWSLFHFLLNWGSGTLFLWKTVTFLWLQFCCSGIRVSITIPVKTGAVGTFRIFLPKNGFVCSWFNWNYNACLTLLYSFPLFTMKSWLRKFSRGFRYFSIHVEFYTWILVSSYVILK